MHGEIVIGEGEIDEAPMLYIGETVGTKARDCAVDIAVDPIDGTRITAMGQLGAIAVLAASEKGALLKAPDMYMEKLVVGPEAKGVIDLNQSIEANIRAVAEKLAKPLSDITLITLVKPRNKQFTEVAHELGCRVFAIPDGDVAASILCCLPESEVDMMYCIGGAPEGVISAAAIRALGGDMQARLLLRSDVHGNSEENDAYSENEKSRCKKMGVQPGEKLKLEQLAKSDNVVFSATGVSKGDLFEGVSVAEHTITTETLLIQGATQSLRKIRTSHRR